MQYIPYENLKVFEEVFLENLSKINSFHFEEKLFNS